MPLGRHFLRKLDGVIALAGAKKKPLRTGAFDVTAAW